MTSPWVGVAGIVIVAGGAWLLRRAMDKRDDTIRMPAAADERDETPLPIADENDAQDDAEAAADDDAPDAEHLALTSDGHAFAPHGRGVIVAPQSHFRRARPAGDDGSRMVPALEEADMQPPLVLSPGDLIAARVVRGSPGLDPWRLETLGRDRDLVVWPFETAEAAEAAHALLDRRIVKLPTDRDGDPVAITDADFDAAQAELEQALEALNAPTEDDELPPPGAGGRRR